MTDEQPSVTDADEWLTVPEAARRLGLPERTARRYAAKLAATDRQLAERGRSLVRLEALANLRDGEKPSGYVAASVADGRALAEEVAASGRKMAADGRTLAETDNRLSDELAVERQARAVAEARLEEISRERDDLRETKDKALQLLDQQQRLSLADRVKIEQLESELREVKKIGASEGKQEDTTETPSASQTSETGPERVESRPSFLQRLFARKKEN